MSDGVWVKVYPEDAGGADLEGLGGWADVTTVTGASGNRYTYKDIDGFDWVAYEWTDDGTLETDAGGLVDALIVGAGGSGGGATDGMGGGPGAGGAGAFIYDITKIETSVTVTVGDGGFANSTARSCEDGKNSSLGSIVAPGGGRGALTNSISIDSCSPLPAASGGGGAYVNNYTADNGRGLSQGLGNDGGLVWNGSRGGGGGGAGTAAGSSGQGGDGVVNSITGNPEGYAGGGWSSEAGTPPFDYGAGNVSSPDARPNSGSGGFAKKPGASGVVIVRVPAKHALATIPGTWGDL